MTEDILERAKPWARECGSCDYGLTMTCQCPDGDCRPIISDLMHEVERLRIVVQAQQDAYDHGRLAERRDILTLIDGEYLNALGIGDFISSLNPTLLPDIRGTHVAHALHGLKARIKEGDA